MTEASTAHAMSELQKKWAKARLGSQALGQPPAEIPTATTMPEFNEADEDKEMAGPSPGGFPFDDDSSSASSVSSTGTVIPSPGRALFARPQGFASRSMDPIPWTTYFERELFLKEEAGSDGGSGSSNSSNKPVIITHHAYLTSPVGKGPLFVTHHGAGSSGLSFAVLSSEIRKRLPNAGILSLDARGHGSTTITTPSSAPGEGGETTEQAPPPLDLSLSTLATDLFTVIQLTRAAMHWPDLPPIILVGHSLGGAVVTELAKSYRLGPSLLGYAVLDVVEGSAMDALQSMQTYLSTRPQGFATLKDGIEWHVRSRTIRNSTSARTSVPGLLAPVEELQRQQLHQPRGVAGTEGTAKPWRWKTDLAATQPFWEDWFVGLSKKFLEARGGKMLLLAGTDRLDTELTIGQMQGKYALQVFPEAGHFIHEDLPEKTAIALVDFHRRNDRSQLVLPAKVSDLLAQGKRV